MIFDKRLRLGVPDSEALLRIEGGFEYQTSELAGALGSDSDDLRSFSFLEGFLGGPVPGTSDKLRFLFAGRHVNDAARVLDTRRF